jgi:hypothetical protein
MNLKFTKLAQQILGEGIGSPDAAAAAARDSHKKPDTSDNLRGKPRPAGFGAEKAQYDDRHSGLSKFGVRIWWKGSSSPKWMKKEGVVVSFDTEFAAEKAAAAMRKKPNVDKAELDDLPS